MVLLTDCNRGADPTARNQWPQHQLCQQLQKQRRQSPGEGAERPAWQQELLRSSVPVPKAWPPPWTAREAAAASESLHPDWGEEEPVPTVQHVGCRGLAAGARTPQSGSLWPQPRVQPFTVRPLYRPQLCPSGVRFIGLSVHPPVLPPSPLICRL